MDSAIPVAAIVMGGLFLSVVVWKVLDVAKHAMSLERTDRSASHRADGEEARR